MENKLIWAGGDQTISKIEGSKTFDYIPNGVWELRLSMTGPYLKKINDGFEFPHKIYGLEEPFITHVMKSFTYADKNTGVLLNGLKGCGKTITAKILANQSNLPVIIVNSSNIDHLSYFVDVKQSLCFLFDEFEKIINHNDTERIAPLLSFVDGSATSTKHLMIFTSNVNRISEFFIDRPGRIRYIKNFGTLTLDVIKEILDDKLEYPEFRNDIIEWVIYFKFLTIDMLTSIINEVNIHAASPNTFKDFFNVDNDKTLYDIEYEFIHPETGRSFVFDSPYSTDKPSEFFEELIYKDRSLQISAKRGSIDKSGKMTVSDSMPRAMYFSYIEALSEDELAEYSTPYVLRASFSKDNTHGFIEPGSKAVITNYEETSVLEENVKYLVQIKMTAKSLYRNYQHLF